MQVVLIGAGHVATVLGRELVAHHHQVLQVWSRTPAHGAVLAAELSAEAITELNAIKTDADLYILAVTDAAIPQIASELRLPGCLVIHCAGSVPVSALQGVSERYGVVWPIKMIRCTMQELGSAPIVVDGNTEEVKTILLDWAHEMSDSVQIADDALRLKMHLVAAVTTNFTNHLYHLAAAFCEAEGVDFGLFYPIIAASVHQLAEADPAAVQSGPAFRGDMSTIGKHLTLIQKYPELLEVYEMMTKSITKKYNV